eukprot:NODE_8425_length_702_cov_173.267703_g8169_i0.p1 GENE.NODE_8425_length_702_cov_173.267703_g8169_i0~~NODE_8425_length_702_cov_173.267703_g8169_i0.p1  ORF type:complete len:167 (-),score=53.82 NODE_8425_length_702_cov_173.267703_g8169_i0:138-638(-)
MPSATTWTAAWVGYYAWIMNEMWNTRKLETGFFPIYTMDSYQTKERFLKANTLIDKYSEELNALEEESITDADIEKFGLTETSMGMAFWAPFKRHPYWHKLEREAQAEIREQMKAEHPDCERLFKANDEGGYKKLFAMDGPWMKDGYDNGLHGHFDGFEVRLDGHH